jgi:hypothetical protein
MAVPKLSAFSHAYPNMYCSDLLILGRNVMGPGKRLNARAPRFPTFSFSEATFMTARIRQAESFGARQIRVPPRLRQG